MVNYLTLSTDLLVMLKQRASVMMQNRNDLFFNFINEVRGLLESSACFQSCLGSHLKKVPTLCLRQTWDYNLGMFFTGLKS